MNNFIFFVAGEEARNYLKGTNYVGVWADTELEGYVKVFNHFQDGTRITPVEQRKVQGEIGYLY